MPKFMYKDQPYGGSTNYASAITCVDKNGEQSTVQAEIDGLNEAVAEQNKNLSTRYNPENDYIEILYNGVWHKSLRAFIQSLKLIENGYKADDFYGNKITQNANNIGLESLGYLCIKLDLTNYTKIIADFSTTSGGNSSAWECLGVLNGSTNVDTADVVKNNAITKILTKNTSANTYVNSEINVSGLNGEHIIAFACYSKTLNITKLQVV